MADGVQNLPNYLTNMQLNALTMAMLKLRPTMYEVTADMGGKKLDTNMNTTKSISVSASHVSGLHTSQIF